MNELTKILGKSYDNADFQNFLRILGKSYEKLKKILRKTYDHNLAILSWPFRSTNTNKYLILYKTRTKEIN